MVGLSAPVTFLRALMSPVAGGFGFPKHTLAGVCPAVAQPVQQPRAGQPRAINNPCGAEHAPALFQSWTGFKIPLEIIGASSGEGCADTAEHGPPACSLRLDHRGASHQPGKARGAAGSVTAPGESEHSGGLARGTLGSQLISSEPPLGGPARPPLPRSGSAALVPADLGLLHPQDGPGGLPLPRVLSGLEPLAPACFWRNP